jgi:phage gpG-like protein
MGLDLIGFDRFNRMLGNAINRVKTEFDKSIHRSALIVQSEVIKGIKSQKWAGEWKPLSKKYVKFKARVNASPHILISGYRGGKPKVRGKGRTKLSNVPRGNYVNSFAVAKIDNASYAVGTNYPQGRALEFGLPARRLPARPHLSLALRDSRESIKRELDETLRRVFKR